MKRTLRKLSCFLLIFSLANASSVFANQDQNEAPKVDGQVENTMTNPGTISQAITPSKSEGNSSKLTKKRSIASHQLIKKSQERLKQLGFDVPTNGKLDEATQDVIRSFQEKHDLIISGELDRPTLRQLESMVP